jgi:hypothetical protein
MGSNPMVQRLKSPISIQYSLKRFHICRKPVHFKMFSILISQYTLKGAPYHVDMWERGDADPGILNISLDRGECIF